jgi:hypothetical protein
MGDYLKRQEALAARSVNLRLSGSRELKAIFSAIGGIFNRLRCQGRSPNRPPWTFEGVLG